MHFYDIVNHPPILREVRVDQDGECAYGSRWTLLGSDGFRYTGRTLTSTCTQPARGGWLNAGAGVVTVGLEFAADELTDGRRMSAVQAHLNNGSSQVPVTGRLEADEIHWSGEFSIPSDGSMDGLWELAVEGRDVGPHFKGWEAPNGTVFGRTASGEELDTEPSTLALASVMPYPGDPADIPTESRDDRKAIYAELAEDSYEWIGYEPGTDRNHFLMIDTTGPAVGLDGADADPQGRTTLDILVEDMASGMQTIGETGAVNTASQVSPFSAGDGQVLLTVTTTDGSRGGSITLHLTDIAGNTSVEILHAPVVTTKNGKPIKAGQKKPIPVVIYGHEGFDPSTLDLASLPFGPLGAAPVKAAKVKDFNNDGHTDVKLKYSPASSGVRAGDSSACLGVHRPSGNLVFGCGPIRTK